MSFKYTKDKISNIKLYPEPVDYKLYPEPVDYKTSWGKGVKFYGDDGKEYATLEQVNQANKEYWESQQIPSKRHR